MKSNHIIVMDISEKGKLQENLDQVLSVNHNLLKTNDELLKEYEAIRNEYNVLANFIEVDVEDIIQKHKQKKKLLQLELQQLEQQLKAAEALYKEETQPLSDELHDLRKTIQKLDDEQNKLNRTQEMLNNENQKLREKYEPISLEYKMTKTKNEDYRMLLREPESEKLKILHERLRLLEKQAKEIQCSIQSNHNKPPQSQSDSEYAENEAGQEDVDYNELQAQYEELIKANNILKENYGLLSMELKIASNKNRDLNEFLKKTKTRS